MDLNESSETVTARMETAEKTLYSRFNGLLVAKVNLYLNYCKVVDVTHRSVFDFIASQYSL